MCNKRGKITVGKEEKMLLKRLISDRTPKYLYNYGDEEGDEFDFLYYYEFMFMFAHDLLRGFPMPRDRSPWGDGYNILYDKEWSEALKKWAQQDELRDYCQMCQKAMEILMKYSE